MSRTAIAPKQCASSASSATASIDAHDQEYGTPTASSLTERELEIARLVVDRRTNAEIAAQLFLSQKTIEAHLRNTFRKVDVANRVELARAVEHADHDTCDLATE